MMPRILFITTKIGFGHERVSHILASALLESIPECTVKIATYFDFFPRRFQSIINTVYVYGLRLFPRVFGYIYLTQKRYKGTGVDFWSKFLGGKYANLIKAYVPDIIIITQGLACQWLGRLKKKGLISVPIIAVVTDYIIHPFWVSSEIDRYIVANEGMRDDLILRGIQADKIAASGIPIGPRFSNISDKDKIRTKLDLSCKKLTILIMGGGWGLGKIDKVALAMDETGISAQLLVVTGKNRSLYRKIKNKKFNLMVRVYGKVDNINELMAAGDIIITKAGGVTASELLASGLPAVLWDIIPGQEEANANYLTENGAAVRVEDLLEMTDTIKKMAGSDDLMCRMRESGRRLGKPNSTMDAVENIRRLIYV